MREYENLQANGIYMVFPLISAPGAYLISKL